MKLYTWNLYDKDYNLIEVIQFIGTEENEWEILNIISDKANFIINDSENNFNGPEQKETEALTNRLPIYYFWSLKEEYEEEHDWFDFYELFIFKYDIKEGLVWS